MFGISILNVLFCSTQTTVPRQILALYHDSIRHTDNDGIIAFATRSLYDCYRSIETTEFITGQVVVIGCTNTL